MLFIICYKYVKQKLYDMEELKIGQKYIGKLQNEYYNKIIEITERMLDDDESTYHFLHYFGFELLNQ